MNPFVLGAVGWYAIVVIMMGRVDAASAPPVAPLQARNAPASCERVTDRNFLDCYAQGFSDSR